MSRSAKPWSGIAKNAILEEVYSHRIKAIRALRDSLCRNSGARLRDCAANVLSGAELYGSAPAASDWRAFAEGLEIAGLLADWRAAALAAEPEAERYLRAARLRTKGLADIVGDRGFLITLKEVLSTILTDFEPDEVADILRGIARLRMPVAIFSDRSDLNGPRELFEAPEEPEAFTVGFLEFIIDGRPADTVHALQAGENHDLDISIRVSRWPDGATSLLVRPVSIEPESTWDLPTFEFEAPTGEPPYVFARQGRMIIHNAQGLHSRPLEFIYAADFLPLLAYPPLVIGGQRSLRLDCTDPAKQPVTGYAGVDKRIIAIRDFFRSRPLISEREIADLLLLLKPLGNLMGQAVQDARYPTPIDEAAFHVDLRQFLRSNSSIGSLLEDQSNIAGGRTDLKFRGIPLELKSEHRSRLSAQDCKKFANQAATYAVGAGRRVSVLCVLDCSPKHEAPFPIEEGLFLQNVGNEDSPVYVVTFLIQGNLGRPSDHSRRSIRRSQAPRKSSTKS